MRLLVVEDEKILANAVAEWLRRESFAVDVVNDGGAAIERFEVNDYDVVILDRDLPVVHGDDVCKHIVSAGTSTRVIMLTAAAGIRSRVEGLAIGADDYLPKPFALAELSARIHALGRRSGRLTPPILERAGIRLDPSRREVTRNGQLISLANREFAVLAELMRADGGVVSAETLLEKVWDEHIDPFTNVVRVTMMKLRRKLGEPQVIETLAGAGYRLP